MDAESIDPRSRGRFSSYDSEVDRKDEVIVPLNLPKGPRKQSPKGGFGGPGIGNRLPKTSGGNSNQQYNRGAQDNNFDDRDQYANARPENNSHQGNIHSNSQYVNNFQPIAGSNRPINYGYDQSMDYRATDINNNYKGDNQGINNFGEKPSDLQGSNEFHPSRHSNQVSFGGSPEVFSGQTKNSENFKVPQQFKTDNEEEKRITSQLKPPESNTKKAEDQKKADDDYDEYEDDFELSESFVPEHAVKGLSKNIMVNKDGDHGNLDKKKDEPIFEDTISMDFDKEFNKNYLDKLDKLVNKNKPNVEVSLPR